jgi:hypothetical protein
MEVFVIDVMILETVFNARCHPNIRCRHDTTIMVTRDERLSNRGDCIAAVFSEKGIADLPGPLKEASRNVDARITLAIEAGGKVFKVRGWGDPALAYTHPDDIVARKSGFVCGRTLMIGADKAARDVEGGLLVYLREENRPIKITITIDM